ncbi:hypothetical protein CBS101457_002111 [Exobasidium rhododendri]|nr:hypothetical protein CBS101457_002111 [Exobasidium rhododendri]
MSFFGFDTSLPRGKSEKPSDPFDPTDGDDDAAFEEKLRGLKAGAQEDVEIYTWGGRGEGGYDGLGDLLDEAGDDLNDDTFGFSSQPVGKDFNFGGSGGDAKQNRTTTAANIGKSSSKTNDAAFASTLDDFWSFPGAIANPTATQGISTPATPAWNQQATSIAASTPAHKTLEEIEAELKASSVQQQPPKPVSSSLNEAHRPLTLEEVEAEMLAKRAQQVSAAPSTAVPAEVSALMQQMSMEQDRRGVPPPQILPSAAFPPLGTQGSPAPPPSQSIPSDPQSHQAHLARMKALLDALPTPLQGRILALPPYMQFSAVESTARQFPALTVAGRVEKLPQQIENPQMWPRADGSVEEVTAIRRMIEAAFFMIDQAAEEERKRQIRLSKISAMSKYNNLMTLSDKDFITRIQVSQLVTSDPYSEDFYAHIFFALRGGATGNPGLMGKKAATTDIPTATTGKGRARKQQQASKRDTAMIRMQQQVERIVQNRKERIEKSTQGVALEGALGRVSLSSTKQPRQMLQVDSVKKEKDSIAKQGEEEGTGHAQDAVRQALQGASLGSHQDGLQKRPALTKMEVLGILENLYDLVLSLEQWRRNAPASAADESDESEAVLEWRHKRDSLTAQLWSELRVLEPLEISDPHPFVSLLSTVKGKRLLPRVLRHLSNEQILTAMTMIVASFDTLDVVKDSVTLDEAPLQRGTRMEKRNDVQRQTDAFAASIVPSMLTLMTTAPMQIVSGMLALFIERNDPIRVAQSKPGIAFLTIFVSRAETLRQQAVDGPSPNELAQWSEIFNLLVQRLTFSPTQLASLFPSTRAKVNLPFGTPIDPIRKNQLEVEDQDVWQLMAALAVSANMNQQQLIVTGLREKILENVLEAKEWKANHQTNSGEEGDIRIKNVNLLLHALNLDAAQITV